jgi:hypothetical protein
MINYGYADVLCLSIPIEIGISIGCDFVVVPE